MGNEYISLNKARAALAVLRFRTNPVLSETLRELAYQQVLTALNRLEELEPQPEEFTTKTKKDQ